MDWSVMFSFPSDVNIFRQWCPKNWIGNSVDEKLEFNAVFGSAEDGLLVCIKFSEQSNSNKIYHSLYTIYIIYIWIILNFLSFFSITPHTRISLEGVDLFAVLSRFAFSSLYVYTVLFVLQRLYLQIFKIIITFSNNSSLS